MPEEAMTAIPGTPRRPARAGPARPSARPTTGRQPGRTWPRH